MLARIYGVGSELLIDREHELKIISAMHELGFAPKLYGRFQNGYVYGYFEGRALEIEGLEFKYSNIQKNFLKQFITKI